MNSLKKIKVKMKASYFTIVSTRPFLSGHPRLLLPSWGGALRDEPKTAALETNFTSVARNSHHLINKPEADCALILSPLTTPPPPPQRVSSSILRFTGI